MTSFFLALGGLDVALLDDLILLLWGTVLIPDLLDIVFLSLEVVLHRAFLLLIIEKSRLFCLIIKPG